MAQKKKTNDKYDKLQYIAIIIVSILLIAAVLFTLKSIDNQRRNSYGGLSGNDGEFPLSSYDSGKYFIDNYYFRGYDDDNYTYKRGIDVSEHQGEIDWPSVKESGVEFAFIRAGFRSSDKGIMKEDVRFKENIQGALDNDIQVGVYFFSQAITVDEAIDEAVFTINLVKDYDVTLPIAYDMEEVSRFKDRIAWLNKSEVTEISDAFCTVVENYGYDSLIYANPSWISSKLELSKLTERKIWLAHYTGSTPFEYKYEIWQYNDSGSVDGIYGKVDLNIMYVEKQ